MEQRFIALESNINQHQDSKSQLLLKNDKPLLAAIMVDMKNEFSHFIPFQIDSEEAKSFVQIVIPMQMITNIVPSEAESSISTRNSPENSTKVTGKRSKQTTSSNKRGIKSSNVVDLISALNFELILFLDLAKNITLYRFSLNGEINPCFPLQRNSVDCLSFALLHHFENQSKLELSKVDDTPEFMLHWAKMSNSVNAEHEVISLIVQNPRVLSC